MIGKGFFIGQEETMGKSLLAVLLLAIVITGAYARDENPIKIDHTFFRANNWLSLHNLAITGGQGGRDDIAAFSQGALLFYGEAAGNPAHTTPSQREMMAKRAAVVVAQRALAEYLKGFALVSDTLVQDCMAEHVIRSSVAASVKGAQVVVQDYSRGNDKAIAIIKLSLHGPEGFASLLYERIYNSPELKKSLTELNGEPAPVFKHPRVGPMDVEYDGLIIDASEQNFKPALVNRIFSAGNELLYDPSKVSQKVLVEQGCGEYTNSVDKAKAALDARGIKNPLIVKAVGTVSAADLQVSDEDAVNIFTANRKTGFLAGAKVAFVLK
jgi:hypothetical protein